MLFTALNVQEGLAKLTGLSSPVTGVLEQNIFYVNQVMRFGKFLAIDIETGEYEISADELRAGNKLRARIPEAQMWMVRIGFKSARSFGGRQERQELP